MTLQSVTPVIEENQLEHRVVDLSRVSRTVKGGRRFRFRAAVLVGDKSGTIGFAVAKGQDVQQAIAKAQAAAQKELLRIPRVGGTIPHATKNRFRGSIILLKPAPEGSGIIAGGPVRAVAELAGIRDISAKIFGSPTHINVVHATLEALVSMKHDTHSAENVSDNAKNEKSVEGINLSQEEKT